MHSKPISREAGDKVKGYRLQRLRAVFTMLNKLEDGDAIHFYSAVENVEDVSLNSSSQDDSLEHYEEDKNYGEGAAFSINSQQVKNTLVSFFDIYSTKWRSSSTLSLGFYTTASIAKEKKVGVLASTDIELPNKPILQLLKDGDYDEPGLLKAVKTVLIDEYEKQYSESVNNSLSELKKITDTKLKEFLSHIVWMFEQADEKELEQILLNVIQRSRLFNHHHEGREEIIKSLLMELFDSRQSVSDYAERFVHQSDLELVFIKAESTRLEKSEDPAWKMWDLHENITDKRNLGEKLISVCPDYDFELIRRLARKVALSRLEADTHGKEFLSLRYRVYQTCYDRLYEMIVGGFSFDNEANLNNAIIELNNAALELVHKVAADYKYKITNEDSIKGMILELIDSCFLSFDEAKDE